MPKLLIATNNPGKLAEFRRLLGALPCRVTGLREEGIAFEVPETGESFEENARLKAEGYARASGLLTLADDSGIEVEALGWRPGVLSARYGGPSLDDAERTQLLLNELGDLPRGRRGARYVCVIALAGPGLTTQAVEGQCQGSIGFRPRGSGGFGYDPVFLLPDGSRTMAELSAAEKDRSSHRGIAARAARRLILAVMRDA